jgi:hypothetical protein
MRVSGRAGVYKPSFVRTVRDRMIHCKIPNYDTPTTRTARIRSTEFQPSDEHGTVRQRRCCAVLMAEVLSDRRSGGSPVMQEPLNCESWIKNPFSFVHGLNCSDEQLARSQLNRHSQKAYRPSPMLPMFFRDILVTRVPHRHALANSRPAQIEHDPSFYTGQSGPYSSDSPFPREIVLS